MRENESAKSGPFVFISNSGHALDKSVYRFGAVVAYDDIRVESSDFSLELSEHLFLVFATVEFPVRGSSKLLEIESMRNSSVRVRLALHLIIIAKVVAYRINMQLIDSVCVEQLL